MTVFLTPTGEPFFGGTYFPKEARAGLPGFVELCRAVDEAWRTRRNELLEQARRLTDALSRVSELAPAAEPIRSATVTAAVDALRSQFDATWGGFGRAPKFPQETSIDTNAKTNRHTQVTTRAFRQVRRSPKAWIWLRRWVRWVKARCSRIAKSEV